MICILQKFLNFLFHSLKLIRDSPEFIRNYRKVSAKIKSHCSSFKLLNYFRFFWQHRRPNMFTVRFGNNNAIELGTQSPIIIHVNFSISRTFANAEKIATYVS